MKLQVNVAGSWRNVVDFDASRRDAVTGALPQLARALGGKARWCIVDDLGKREWLGTLTDALEAKPQPCR